MVVTVVYAKKKDIVSAAKILQEAYYSSISSATKTLIEKIKTKEVIIALEQKMVVGVLIYTRNYSHYANYIEDICVSKANRRKGIATKLLRGFIKISRKETPKKQKYALSSTTITNIASIKMHLKFGFREIGRLKELHYNTDEVFFGYKL